MGKCAHINANTHLYHLSVEEDQGKPTCARQHKHTNPLTSWTHTHPHTHAHTHTHTHTNTHLSVEGNHWNLRMRAHTYAQTHTHTHTQFTNTHTRTHTHVHLIVGEVVYDLQLFTRSTLKFSYFCISVKFKKVTQKSRNSCSVSGGGVST